MLLESVVAIALISIVMAALATFFVNSVSFTTLQRSTQIATVVANSTVDAIRSLPVSDPVNGHDATSVAAQFAGASRTVSPWLVDMVPAVDTTATTPNSGTTAPVPTVAVPQTINNVTYFVNTYLGTCLVPANQQTGATCGLGAATSGIKYLRVVVAVTWTGPRCGSGTCTYVTATLLSPQDDPLFNLNQSPPTAPTLTNPGNQVSAVGDTISLQPTYTAIPTSKFAVTSGTLPPGLILNPATGQVTGTPSAVTASTLQTLTLTDGFGRATTASFTWQVLASLATTPPAAQANITGTPIGGLTLSASGGSPGYAWTDPGTTLPPGLILTTVNNQAVVSGTPTAVGVFPVSLTVTDSTGTRRATVSFSWTISYPPFSAANPGPQTTTVGAAVSTTLTVTGGSGSFSWAGGATLPAGLTLTPAGVISGSPARVGTSSVALTVTDSKTSQQQNVSFTWTVLAAPTVTSPGNQSVTVGQGVSLQLGTTCPNTPCSYALKNGPATFGISSTGLLSGTVTSTPQTFAAATLTVTDNSGVTVSSATFSVKVNAAPSFSSPGNQTVAPGAAVSLDAAALVSGGTGPLTYTATRLPGWLTLNSSTGRITGTAPAAGGTTTGVVLTVTDAGGIASSTPGFNWTVGAPPSAPLSVTVANGDGAATVNWAAPTTGPVAGYTVLANPGGRTCTTTGALTCTITGLTNGVVYSLTVQATNAFGTGPASAAVIGIPYPASVMSAANGMTLWLDGADPAVLLTNPACTGAVTTTTVGCWKDKSGNGNNFTQTSTASQPGVATWNGLSATNFIDPGDILNSVNAAAQYQTVFVAANVTNGLGGTTQNQWVDLFGQANFDYNVRIGSGVGRANPNPGGTAQNSNDWSFGTAGPQNWVNSVPAVNVTPPRALITTDQAPAVRSFAASVSNTVFSRGVVGQVGDVVTFNKVLTTDQRRAVESYLSNKWGVPIAAPAVPGPPQSVSAARPTGSSVAVSWTPPVFDGGSAVTGYTVTSSPGGLTCVAAGSTSCTVTGLASRTSYTFAVTAQNSVGTGASSTPSNAVTP